MKRLATLFLVISFAAVAASPALADPDAPFATPETTWSEADWEAFSENLIAGLRSDNDGLRASALQMIVRYGDRLDMSEAAFDVVRLYRDHEDERVRRLAAVTCTKLKSKWAVSFLRMSEPFERSESIQHTIRALLAEHDGHLIDGAKPVEKVLRSQTAAR
jgi:hypothetical protein